MMFSAISRDFRMDGWHEVIMDNPTIIRNLLKLFISVFFSQKYINGVKKTTL